MKHWEITIVYRILIYIPSEKRSPRVLYSYACHLYLRPLSVSISGNKLVIVTQTLTLDTLKIMGDWKYKRLESSVLVVAKKNSTHEQGLTLLVGFEEEATTCFGKFRHPHRRL